MCQLCVNWQYWRGCHGNSPFCIQFSIPLIALHLGGDIINCMKGWNRLIICVWFLEILQFHLSVCNFSLNLCNAANWCKELTVFPFCWYRLLGNFSVLSICAQLCLHTACSLLVILLEALYKQSFFYTIFNSQNNIVSMRPYPELYSLHEHCILKTLCMGH